MIVFTLFLILPMLLMGGIAVDMMRFETSRSRLQSALDRAVLAAADLDVCLDPAQSPEAVVQDYVARSGFAGMVTNIDVQKGFNSCEVHADAQIQINTIFLAMVAVDHLGTPASSGATESIDDIEVSLVLDVSGSMGQGSGRIEALRTAGAAFVATVLNSVEDGHATISVVPYSTQVNLGPHLFSQFLSRFNHAYSYCLDLPSSLYTRTDVPLQTRYNQTAHFDPFSGYNSSSIHQPTYYACGPSSSSWVVPISDNIGQLQTYIQALQPDANTSIEMGAKWGVALLDPAMRPAIAGLASTGQVESQYATRPLSWEDGNTLKFMVLMTDGENTQDFVMNTAYRDQLSDVWYQDRSGSNDRFFIDQQETNDTDNDNRTRERYFLADTSPVSYGSRQWDNTRQGVRLTWQDVWARMPVREQAYHFRYRQYANASTYYSWYDNLITVTYTAEKDARLAQVCTAAKARGIVIFTIGFNITNRAAQIMSSCASSPNNFYRIADLDINSAFNSIANQISQLRLIQ